MSSSTVFVNDTASLHALLNTLTGLDLTTRTTAVPSLYIDLEGNRLSRNGTISLLTLLLLPRNTIYLLDITTLGRRAFTDASPHHPPTSLQTILQDPSIPKVFFDVRNDSDALFAHFQIRLAGIVDLQLLELGSRSGGLARKRTVSGLARCIRSAGGLTAAERGAWEAVKERGVRLFAPEKGGRYEVFDERPLSRDVMDYCVQDVRFLPALWDAYVRRLGGNVKWTNLIEQAVLDRVEESQGPAYDPHSDAKALGPWV